MEVTRGIRFLLTGSSARKLRRTLPPVYFSDDPEADLEAYAGAYLQQEVMAEAAVRNISAFSQFLKVAVLCNGTIVNFTKISNDAQVPRTTVYEYFEILRDTLILHELPAWRRSVKRKPIAASKFYFFDVGVVSALQGRAIRPETPEFGQGFETYLMHELAAYVDYRSGDDLAYWRSTSGFEVRFHHWRSHGNRSQSQNERLQPGSEGSACSRGGREAEALSVRQLGPPAQDGRWSDRGPVQVVSRCAVGRRIPLKVQELSSPWAATSGSNTASSGPGLDRTSRRSTASTRTARSSRVPVLRF